MTAKIAAPNRSAIELSVISFFVMSNFKEIEVLLNFVTKLDLAENKILGLFFNWFQLSIMSQVFANCRWFRVFSALSGCSMLYYVP